MKFFELTQCLEPAVPGGLSRAPYLRELISMFTTVTEDEWTTRNDPSTLPSDATLESMASRDSGFPKKLAKAICAKLDTAPFVWHMNELSHDTQELIARHIAVYGEHVDVEDFAYDVTALLVDILHTKAGLSDKTSGLLHQIRIQAAQAKYEKLSSAKTRSSTSAKPPKPSTTSPGTSKPPTPRKENHSDYHVQTLVEAPYRPRHDQRRRPPSHHRKTWTRRKRHNRCPRKNLPRTQRSTH